MSTMWLLGLAVFCGLWASLVWDVVRRLVRERSPTI